MRAAKPEQGEGKGGKKPQTAEPQNSHIIGDLRDGLRNREWSDGYVFFVHLPDSWVLERLFAYGRRKWGEGLDDNEVLNRLIDEVAHSCKKPPNEVSRLSLREFSSLFSKSQAQQTEAKRSVTSPAAATVESIDAGGNVTNPKDPTAYVAASVVRLEHTPAGLIIAHDQDRGTDRSVRKLVMEFRGLTGTAKQKAVLEDTGLIRTDLSALTNGDGLEHDTIAKLLTSMQAHSKPVRPPALGIIGEAHSRARLEQLGYEMETFPYKKITEMDSNGLPMVIEAAFAWCGGRSPTPDCATTSAGGEKPAAG